MRTAALETLAENLSDGVIAPLFWYLLLGYQDEEQMAAAVPTRPPLRIMFMISLKSIPPVF